MCVSFDAGGTNLAVKSFIDVPTTVLTANQGGFALYQVKFTYRDGVIQFVFNEGTGASAIMKLATILVDDSNPTLMSLISLNILPATFNGYNVPFASTPRGCFVLTSTTQISLAIASDCSAEYITDKISSSPLCKDVSCADLPLSSAYCPPCNPYVVAADMDPCDVSLICREVAQPAGTHIPCATLNLDTAAFKNLTNFNGLTGNSFRLFDGCRNRFGCEYWACSNTTASSVRFVLDQNCNLLNAATGGATIESPVAKQFIAIRCHYDATYALETTTGNLYINPQLSVATAYLNFNTITSDSGFINIVLDRHYIYVYNAKKIYAIDLNTKAFVPGPTASHLADTSGLGGSVTTLYDAVIVDHIFVSFAGIVSVPNQTLLKIAIPLLSDGSFKTINFDLGTATTELVYFGLCKHPVLPIVYQCVNLNPTTTSVNLLAYSISATSSPNLIAQVSIGSSSQNTGSLCYRRPRFCDGVIQVLLPQTSFTSLVTLRTNDQDPAEITLVSSVPLQAPPVVSLTSLTQFVATASGCYVIANTDNNNTSLQVFKPDSITPQKYINIKPFSLPSSILAFVPLQGAGPLSSSQITLTTLTNMVSNFSEINAGTFVTGAAALFPQTRNMLISLNVLCRCSVFSTAPSGINSLNARSGATIVLKDEQVFTANTTYTFHIHGVISIGPSAALTLLLVGATPAIELYISAEFLRYV